MNESLKTNQLYAAAFLVENYLKLLPDESMLENMICKQVQSRQATRGIWDMLDFYSILGDFWEKHGSQYEDLDWFTMYDTYSDDVAFKKMFKKKEKEVKVIWSGKGLPTRDQMKSIVQKLNKHPEKTEQIDAAVQVFTVPYHIHFLKLFDFRSYLNFLNQSEELRFLSLQCLTYDQLWRLQNKQWKRARLVAKT